ncbi:hypothetical protein JTS97_08545 [Clostridium botulinum]|nr:hypothetical protein [Clostridium botulinum]
MKTCISKARIPEVIKGPTGTPPKWEKIFSIFRSLINNSIQLARATELALPIIATTNIDNNIMLDSI